MPNDYVSPVLVKTALLLFKAGAAEEAGTLIMEQSS